MRSSGSIDPQPEPFFTVRASKDDSSRSLTGLCVGYEKKKWRASQLASHVMEWIPEFALNWTEREGLRHQNSVRLLRKAAATIYTTNKFKKRGEFGELLLHAAIRQVFTSSPAISKIYYKTAANETVKGFDAVHVVGIAGDLELWLGEVKFYTSIKLAMRDAVKELCQHTDADYLKAEFALISNKLDAGWPYCDEVRKLLSPNTSLDDVFTRVCIPVMLTYDSDCLAAHEECGEAYASAFKSEIESHYSDFCRRHLPPDIRVHLFLLPLQTKQALVTELDKRLKQWQTF